MKKIPSCALVVIPAIVSIASLLGSTFSSLEARLLLFFAFFSFFFSISYFVRRNKELGIYYSVAIATLFIFLINNKAILSTQFLRSLSTNEAVIRAQQYSETGAISFDAVHSYFFQTPYLMHAIGTLCGVPPSIAIYGITLGYVALMTLIGIYALRLVRNYKRIGSVFSLSLIALLLVSSSTMIIGSMSFYRDLSLSLLLLLLCYCAARVPNTRKDFHVILVLVVGTTVGSPISSLVMILFFFILAFQKKQSARSLLYGIIPLAYMIFVAHEWFFSIMRYSQFSISGILRFIEEIFGGDVPQRVIPWKRTISTSLQDSVINSSSFIGLLLLATLTAMCIVFFIRRNRFVKKESEPLLKTFSLYLWITLAVLTVTYIGASVNPETTFSDIRTIAIIFVSTVLPAAFLSKEFFERLFSMKVLSAIVALLMLLASFRVVYEVHPKSVYDPINVIEDSRLCPTIQDVGDYIKTYSRGGYFIVDFRMRGLMELLLPPKKYEIHLLSEKSLSTASPFSTNVLVFHVYGIKYPSMYISAEAYLKAYNLSLTRNRIYDDGNVVIVLIQPT